MSEAYLRELIARDLEYLGNLSCNDCGAKIWPSEFYHVHDGLWNLLPRRELRVTMSSSVSP
jgi:hypothetical protein